MTIELKSVLKVAVVTAAAATLAVVAYRNQEAVLATGKDALDKLSSLFKTSSEVVAETVENTAQTEA